MATITTTLLPTHPSIDTFREDYDAWRESGYDHGEAASMANSMVDRMFNFRFSADGIHAILTAPKIATERGRFHDALRLIAVAFKEAGV